LVITEVASKFVSFFATTLFITTLKMTHHWILPKSVKVFPRISYFPGIHFHKPPPSNMSL